MRLVKSKQRVADHGEVFTPPWMVEAMLSLVSTEAERIDSRFLEPACGSGNFLVPVLRRKLHAVEKKYGKSDFEKRHYALFGLMCIYGIELLEDNVAECREDMLQILIGYLDLDASDDLYRAATYVLSRNIVHGDALTMLTSTGQFPLGNQPPAGTVTAPPRGPTATYGKYLVSITGCATCHGPALDAQNIPRGTPQGPSLRIVKLWSEPEFLATLRTGVDPAKHQLSDMMPWRQYGQGTDDDLRAIYQFLTSLQ
jgi:mono/diheme cytochrome c family protein